MSARITPEGRKLYAFGPFRIDPDKELLLREGKTVPLTPKTFQILLVLVRNSKEIVTKDDLMKTVWPGTFVEEGNVSRNIFMLRKALGETEQERYIVTVPAAEAGLVLAKMKGAGVPCMRIGTTGGDAIAISGEAQVTVEALKAGFERWLPAYMNGAA